MKAITQPRAFETREKILQAAAHLFALKGYHDAKLEEVLDTAQVSKGAFFHQFRDREDLGFAVLDWHMEKRRQLLDAIEQELPLAKQADPLQQVFRRLDAIQEMVRRRENCKGGCIIGNMSTALSDCHDGFRKRLAECFDEMAQEFLPHLRGSGTAGARDAADEYQRVGPVHRHGHRRSDHAGSYARRREAASPSIGLSERAPEEKPGTVKPGGFFRV